MWQGAVTLPAWPVNIPVGMCLGRETPQWQSDRAPGGGEELKDYLLESRSALLGTGLEVDRTDDTEDYLSSLCLAELSDLRDGEQWH